MATDRTLTQHAPWPSELEALVARVRYRPGWRVWLESDAHRDDDHGRGTAGGTTLVIRADVMDSYHPENHRPVLHYFIVPAATYNKAAWLRWLFDCFLQVEQHESCEWFGLALVSKPGEDMPDTPAAWERPFAPNHGPGANPYTIVQYASDEDRRMSFRGVLNDA
jgi:hypothetical protein